MFMDDDSFKLNTQYIAALPWQYSGSRRVVFLWHIAKMKVSDKMEKSLSSFSAHFRFIKYTSFFALSLSLSSTRPLFFETFTCPVTSFYVRFEPISRIWRQEETKSNFRFSFLTNHSTANIYKNIQRTSELKLCHCLECVSFLPAHHALVHALIFSSNASHQQRVSHLARHWQLSSVLFERERWVLVSEGRRNLIKKLPVQAPGGTLKKSLNNSPLTLIHVMWWCDTIGIPFELTTHRNSAVAPIFTLITFGTISTWSGVETVSRSSAFASPPAFATVHL